MNKQVHTNMTVTILSDGNQTMKAGKLTSGNCIIKEDGCNILFLPQALPLWKRAEHNPIIFEGEFFSSRIKKNGHYSLHGVVSPEDNLAMKRQQALSEVETFFSKLEAML